MAQGGPSQPALRYEEAISILEGMFEGWPRESLGEVLQANSYNMEATVEAILALGAPPSHAVSADRGSAGPVVSPASREVRAPAAPAPAEERRGKAVTLPDDFLRVPGRKGPAVPSGVQQQLALDEQVALMLQDELFMRELRANPEFMERRQAMQHLSSGGGGPRPRAGSPGGDTLDDIAKGLRDVGDSVKQSLVNLYHKFQRGRDLDPGSHVPLMEDEEEDDEGEVVVFGNDGKARRRSPTGTDMGMDQARTPRRGTEATGAQGEEADKKMV